MVGFPTSFVEWAGAPLLAVALLRLFWTRRVYARFLAQPLSTLTAAFILWNLVSLLWSPDAPLGLRQAGLARWALTVIALWPVITARQSLILSLAAGLLCGSFSQALHAIGTHWGIEAIRWDRAPDRNSGWWKPVVGASMLVGALGLHLPAALRGAGLVRWVGLGGVSITALGIVATGSRGAWIAAALLIVAGTISAIRASARPRRAIWALASAAVVLALVLGLAWPRIGPAVLRRFELARTEIRDAVEHGNYASDTGARIAMARWAALAYAAHPIVGVGAGGYQAWVRSQQADTPEPTPVHAHAHNSALHIAATTGTIGLALALGALALALRNAAIWGRRGPTPYEAGPLFALIGLVLVSPFDPVHLNAQTSAFLATLLVLCPSWIPVSHQPTPPKHAGVPVP